MNPPSFRPLYLHTCTGDRYAKSAMEQLPIVLSRQLKLLKGGRATTIGRLLQCIIMGIFSGGFPKAASS